MERVKLNFLGLMTDLPDETAPMGALQDAINIRHKDGALRPTLSKKTDWKHDYDIKNYYVHSVEGSDVEIMVVYNTICYRRWTGSSWSLVAILSVSNGGGYIRFASFNRVLIITDHNTGYMWVAKMTPNGTQSTYSTALKWDISLPVLQITAGSTTNTDFKYFTAIEKPKEIAKGVFLGLKDAAAKENRILGVVFVRYALKLYDGSYICYSPIRYVVGKTTYTNTIKSYGTYAPGSGGVPTAPEFEAGDNVTSKFLLITYSTGIDYKIPVTIGSDTVDNSSIVASLQTYRDYIKSLDIFVSEQFEVDDIDNIPAELETVATAQDITALSLKPSEYFEKLDNFYLVKSIPIETLSCHDTTVYSLYSGIEFGRYNTGEGSVVVSTTKTKFDTITTQKAMQLQDNPHNISAKIMKVYNNRLFMGNIVERLFRGYDPINILSRGVASTGTEASITMIVYLDTEDGEKIVKSSSTLKYVDTNYNINLPLYLTYPDQRAKSIQLYVYVGSTYQRKSYSMKRHPFLNLAYAVTATAFPFTDSVELAIYSYLGGAVTLPTENNLLLDENRLMISRVNNPFAYRAEDTNIIGMSDILAIAVNTIALSAAQYGNYPLFIFTADGIYAMEIGEGSVFAKRITIISNDISTGEVISVYSKSMKRDVIAYLTRDGLKILNGANPEDITDMVKHASTSKLAGADYTFYTGFEDFYTPKVDESDSWSLPQTQEVIKPL